MFPNLPVAQPVGEHVQRCWQVLGEMFNCLHRAQSGSAATSGSDPQLPQLVRVPRAVSSSSLAGLASPDPHPHHPSSMAQDVFGLKVQVHDSCFSAFQQDCCAASLMHSVADEGDNHATKIPDITNCSHTNEGQPKGLRAIKCGNAELSTRSGQTGLQPPY